jgi:isoleucyl-tRNA synthetase
MNRRYPEYKQLDLKGFADEVRNFWETEDMFRKSLEKNANHQPFIFFEGPPSANGMPGIHHVMARAIKDIFCRYKTQKGYHVARKAGWDTHGLPVEIAVEKKLGITKEDIGKSISVEEYNRECRTEVMKYKDQWDELTRLMGYWVDLDHPYITFENKYIESVWYLLSELYNKDLLYKGYTIQPYSPAAGTGLSTHELNQPGCYRNVKDNTVTAQFKVVRDEISEFLFEEGVHGDLFFLAWTTTPWTLPSNTALAVGAKIEYVKVKTFNAYTHHPITVILAWDLVSRFFHEQEEGMTLESYEPGQKKIPWEICGSWKGKELEGVSYEQLLPYAQPEDGDAFHVVTGDFVTTEDGTGIVHIAPSFGADDFKVARENGIGSLTMVNKQGMFIEAMGEFAGRYVKNEYDPHFDSHDTSDSVDVDIIVKLKKENKAFKTEKYEHSYPHCWRTDKPILYYPLDSWFIRTTAYKDKMLKLNQDINWKPASTGTGRFGNWLENLVDWNLSRSRYWGTPLPIWATEDQDERLCIGSVALLKKEINRAVEAGLMASNPLAAYREGDMSEENYHSFDLHRPFVDEIVLLSPKGKPMYREPDLIDVWFDSGAMPYAQFHYPFENKENLKDYFPADFIAEGVDQTRGWFFTLHAIAVMLFGTVSNRTIVSNGLVLDKNGNKMSKRLGNAVNPFEVMEKYGPDALRWYMITNSQPWDNLKFDLEGVAEVQRKFFGTLYNTYAFFALYANIDGFDYSQDEVPRTQRPEIDRWILSELNTLIAKVDEYYDDYEPTKAGRAIVEFVYDYLSNWYVRLSRRRFWKSEDSNDKISAYQTLYRCLEVVAQLAAPIAPFYMDKLFTDLNRVTGREEVPSVHLADFPEAVEGWIDKDLEERMQMAQKISSMVLSLRKRNNIRVRQPLQRIMVPVDTPHFEEQMRRIEKLVLSEVNVKSLEYVRDSAGVLVKRVKPNFKSLGPRYGKLMKQIASAVAALDQKDIAAFEKEKVLRLSIEGEEVEMGAADLEVSTEDIPGWVVANEGNLTVALDISISDELYQEGLARELINRIQNLRKDRGFEVTDKIRIVMETREELLPSIERNIEYICAETLAESLELVDTLAEEEGREVELTEEVSTRIHVSKMQ